MNDLGRILAAIAGLKARPQGLVPEGPVVTPADGTARLFVDAADGVLKAKKDDGSTVDLESGGGGGSDPKAVRALVSLRVG